MKFFAFIQRIKPPAFHASDLTYLAGEVVGIAGILNNQQVGAAINTAFHTSLGSQVVATASFVSLIGAKVLRVKQLPAGTDAGEAVSVTVPTATVAAAVAAVKSPTPAPLFNADAVMKPQPLPVPPVSPSPMIQQIGALFASATKGFSMNPTSTTSTAIPVTATPTFEGQLLDTLKAFYDANRDTILDQLKQQNVVIAQLVENALISFVSQNSLLKLIFGRVLVGAGPQLVTLFGGEEASLSIIIDNLLAAEAANLGG